VAETTPLREQLERRLAALQAEFDRGERMLADFDAQRASLRDTLLRLAGAITVLKEELDVAPDDGRPASADKSADAR
jgi:hypothetical protein